MGTRTANKTRMPCRQVWVIGKLSQFDVSPIFVTSHVLNAVAASIPLHLHEETRRATCQWVPRWARYQNTTDAGFSGCFDEARTERQIPCVTLVPAYQWFSSLNKDCRGAANSNSFCACALAHQRSAAAGSCMSLFSTDACLLTH